MYRNIEVGPGASIGRGCRLRLDPHAHLVLGAGSEVDDGTTLAVYGSGRLELGERAFVGHHCTLAARELVQICEGTFLAELVSVRDHDHAIGTPPSSGTMAVSPVFIGAHAWLGAKVTVLKGSSVGDRAVVGANAVVHGTLPPSTVAAGVPARVLRKVEDGTASAR